MMAGATLDRELRANLALTQGSSWSCYAEETLSTFIHPVARGPTNTISQSDKAI